MNDVLQWIGTIANLVAACAVFFAIKQLTMQRKAWADEHERSRREKAIELISNFNDKFGKEWSATRRLVEKLTQEQLLKMDEGEPFDIDGKYGKFVVGALPGAFPSSAAPTYAINSEQSYQLRFQALEILNATEIICEAWESDVANTRIVERQLLFLYDPNAKEPTDLMHTYRRLMDDDDNFPSITNYIRVQKEKRKKREVGLPRVNESAERGG